MTRKDYVLIANRIGQMTYLNETDRATVAHDFAEILATENPRFDSARFLSACGVSE